MKARPYRQLIAALLAAPLAIAAPVAAQTVTSPALQDGDGFAAALPARSDAPPIMYRAREVRTMDPKRPVAEAFVTHGGRFLAVGSVAELRSRYPTIRMDDRLADKVVVAGFVEQHVHPVLAALTMNTKVISIEDWDAIDGPSPAVRDAKTYQAKLAAAVRGHADKTKPFVTWGYHHYFHGAMNRALLDKLAPDFPVIVWHRSAHEFFLNTAALKSTGINEALVKGLPASAQGQIDYGKGHFYEQGAMAILGKLTPILASPDAFRRGLEFTETYYHRNGITFACEPGGFYSKALQDFINSVHSDNDTPFNHCFIGDGKTFAANHPDDPAAMIAEARGVESWGRGRTFFLPKQVKFLTDGAIYSQLMMMKDGYTDGHHGAWIMDPKVFDYAFDNFWDAGFQIHVHNNGDAGAEVLLAALERAMKRTPRKDHRTVWVHFGFSTPAQVKRWAELGGIVSSNPYYVTALAGRYAKLGIGPERSANIAAHGDVMANGGMGLSFHSDMPMAPAKPLQLVWAGMTRLTAEGQVAGPQHRVDIDTAMRAITVEAARSIQLEHRIGTVAPGKDANLTILDQSPWAVPADQLREIKIWGTMLEGRLQPVAVPTRTGTNGAAAVPTAGVPEATIAQLQSILSAHAHSAGQ
jgi:predicted amidohydrolase YtcJ